MRTSVVLAVALVLFCTLNAFSNADPIHLQKRSVINPLEKALTAQIRQELDAIEAELEAPKTRVARAAETDPEAGNGGGGLGGIVKFFLNIILILPRTLLRLGITGISVITGLGSGIGQGIVGILESILSWLDNLTK